MKPINLLDEIHNLIPGGAHTYSRGDDQFPSNAPKYLVKGKGAKIWDQDGRQYWDMSMGLRSVSIGHAESSQLRYVNKIISKGVNLARPVLEEFELAEKIRSLIPSAEMVKFGKNGSDVNTAAVRLARAATGRKLILRCSTNPFLSVNDWFIGSTVMNSGIPEEISELTLQFPYGDIAQVEKIFEDFGKEIACIILEPFGSLNPDIVFLEYLRKKADQFGTILIFDEVISGFRFDIGGAQKIANVVPDLSTFAKGIANGFPFSALVGKKEIMDLGGIRHEKPRVFLLSSTYGSERSGIAAAMWTISYLEKHNSIATNWEVAEAAKLIFNETAAGYSLQDRIKLIGPAINPTLSIDDVAGAPSGIDRATFLGIAIENGLFLPYFSYSARHRDKFLKDFRVKIDRIFNTFARTSSGDVANIYGEVKPVFRKFN